MATYNTGSMKFPVKFADVGLTVDHAGNYVSSNSFGLRVASGEIPGVSIEHVFGHNDAVNTTINPISTGGIYRTPQVSGATQLRIKAGGNANDTASGSGARAVTIEGLDATGAKITETVLTNGISASANTINSFLRVSLAFVSASGTYADAANGSHVGDITIENAAGTQDWAVIGVHGFGESQTEIGAFTIPLSKTGYITQIGMDVDATKIVDVAMFYRTGILDTAPPYSALRVFHNFVGLDTYLNTMFTAPMGPFVELTDIVSMANVAASTASVSIDFGILLIDND